MQTGTRWKLKVLVQAVLAHLPGGEKINHQLQRSSGRARPDYVARRMAELAQAFDVLKAQHSIKDAVVVEVGTGWDALPTLCLSGEGAARIHTYDHVRHLRFDLVRDAAAAAVSFSPAWKSLAAVSSCEGLSDALESARVSYTAPGDAARTGLADNSVDIYFSYAVLEHVPEQAARDIFMEARRVLKLDGVFYAMIGLHDHYNGFDPRVSKINFLRYPEWLWRLMVQNKISYHNRLRERDFLDMLGECGAVMSVVNSTIDPADLEALNSMRIDRRFERFTPEELATTRTEIIARFPAGGRS